MRTPRCLKFSQPMEPEDVSLAWEYLFSLPSTLLNQQEPPPPPEPVPAVPAVPAAPTE